MLNKYCFIDKYSKREHENVFHKRTAIKCSQYQLHWGNLKSVESLVVNVFSLFSVQLAFLENYVGNQQWRQIWSALLRKPHSELLFHFLQKKKKKEKRKGLLLLKIHSLYVGWFLKSHNFLPTTHSLYVGCFFKVPQFYMTDFVSSFPQGSVRKCSGIMRKK